MSGAVASAIDRADHHLFSIAETIVEPSDGRRFGPDDAFRGLFEDFLKAGAEPYEAAYLAGCAVERIVFYVKYLAGAAQ